MKAPTGAFPPDKSAGLSAGSCVTSQHTAAYETGRMLVATKFVLNVLKIVQVRVTGPY
jgi:hypothetical protein